MLVYQSVSDVSPPTPNFPKKPQKWLTPFPQVSTVNQQQWDFFLGPNNGREKDNQTTETHDPKSHPLKRKGEESCFNWMISNHTKCYELLTVQ